MMSSDDKFKDLVKAIAHTLEEQGFLQKKETFYIMRNGNWGVINFQRSTKNSINQVFFTVNLGVASQRLLTYFSNERRGRRLEINDCHWRQRLGFFLPERRDTWWLIDSETSLLDLIREMKGYILDLALPNIDLYLQDERLRDLWLSETSPGLTDLSRLMNLSVLIKALGPKEVLETVLEQLKRESEKLPSTYSVDCHLKRLERETSR